MCVRRLATERLLLIALLLFGFLAQACSTATAPTDPLEPAPPDPVVPAPLAGEILGLVTGDGAPRSGVTVTLSQSGSEVATVVTTEIGEFGFTDLDAGTYGVAISEIAGMNCSRHRIAPVVAGEKTEVSFACVTPPPVGTVEGRVSVNGVGAAGVSVAIRDATTHRAIRTANDGTYRFTNVPIGAKTVWINTEEPCPGTHQENTRREVGVTVSEEGVAVADFACMGQAVTGRVTVNGIGGPGLRVFVCYDVWDYGCVQPLQATDSDGRYAYTSLHPIGYFPARDYFLFVDTPPEISCPERHVPVPSGVTVTVDFRCVRPGSSSGVGSVTLLPDSLTVAVYDTAQLTVIVRDTTGLVITNPHVAFSVNGLMAGTVDNTGLVTGLPGGCGIGTVIAQSGGVNSNAVVVTIGSLSGAGCWD